MVSIPILTQWPLNTMVNPKSIPYGYRNSQLQKNQLRCTYAQLNKTITSFNNKIFNKKCTTKNVQENISNKICKQNYYMSLKIMYNQIFNHMSFNYKELYNSKFTQRMLQKL